MGKSQEWDTLLDWLQHKDYQMDESQLSPPFGKTKKESYIPLYDFMGMIGTSGLIFLFYYYHNEKPYSFRRDLGYKRGIFTGGVQGRLAQVNRRSPNYYTVPSVFQNSVVFTITEWEFQTTLIYDELFCKSNFQFDSRVRINGCDDRKLYDKNEILALFDYHKDDGWEYVACSVHGCGQPVKEEGMKCFKHETG